VQTGAWKKRNWEELVEVFGGGDVSTVEKKDLGKKCFYGFICGAAFQYGNLICKLFFSNLYISLYITS
jgi:hypothetical protein